MPAIESVLLEVWRAGCKRHARFSRPPHHHCLPHDRLTGKVQSALGTKPSPGTSLLITHVP